jgi:hypothetical protein
LSDNNAVARAANRREKLLAFVEAFGPEGVAVAEAVDYEILPGDRNPVRTVALRASTTRSDLVILERQGRLERISKKSGSRRVAAWRSSGGAHHG